MTKSDRRLYWAYGSNLNKAHMAQRCPGATPVAKLTLPRARLVFRSVADVVYDAESNCPGGLWRISREDEAALDRYEGVAGGLYEKRYILVRIGGREERCLLYTMRSREVAPPGQGYLATIVQGYKDFGLDLAYLDRTVEAAWDEKAIGPDVRRRRARTTHGAIAYGVDLDNGEAVPL
jgi:hypothetical protein